jgi:hypothetical protein
MVWVRVVPTGAVGSSVTHNPNIPVSRHLPSGFKLVTRVDETTQYLPSMGGRGFKPYTVRSNDQRGLPLEGVGLSVVIECNVELFLVHLRGWTWVRVA